MLTFFVSVALVSAVLLASVLFRPGFDEGVPRLRSSWRTRSMLVLCLIVLPFMVAIQDLGHKDYLVRLAFLAFVAGCLVWSTYLIASLRWRAAQIVGGELRINRHGARESIPLRKVQAVDFTQSRVTIRFDDDWRFGVERHAKGVGPFLESIYVARPVFDIRENRF